MKHQHKYVPKGVHQHVFVLKEMRCLAPNCPHQWTSGTACVQGCPLCGSLYVQWVNYQLWTERKS